MRLKWKNTAIAGVGAATLVAISLTPSGANALAGNLRAHNDTYSTQINQAKTVGAAKGLLANDNGQPLTVVDHTQPAHGTVTVNADGAFSYTPNFEFKGTDSFTYTVSNAVQIYSTHLPQLGTFGGVSLTSAAFGSSLAPVPGVPGEFYGLEDRGPNGTAANGDIVLPQPDYDPAIAKFKFVNGAADLLTVVPLKAADGTPYSGRVNSANPTGETAVDLAGNTLAQDPNGYDPEGLVALPDGTFWVSDEYGPFITHFAANGRAIKRLTPLDGSLPAELVNRVPNKGMEGLTITPDGTTLVGAMQSALQQPDLGSTKGTKVAITRIVTYNLKSHAVHEYLYTLDNPGTTGTANSELTALSDTTFLMDERDGNFPPHAYKKLYKINIAGATDVGPSAHVAGAVYDGTHGGLLIGGKSLEATVGTQDTADATATLAADGVKVVGKSLYLDLGGLLDQLNPTGAFFGHDKVEGVAALNGGKTIVVSNDSDFGLGGVANATPPYTLTSKILPGTGTQDEGQYLEINMNRLPAGTSTATVTITVR
ncbi:MAG TPA: esterase-like activity of phytase family protein [Micromonosporaceae bacterium]